MWDDVPHDSTTQFGSASHREDVLPTFDAETNKYENTVNTAKADILTDRERLKLRLLSLKTWPLSLYLLRTT